MRRANNTNCSIYRHMIYVIVWWCVEYRERTAVVQMPHEGNVALYAAPNPSPCTLCLNKLCLNQEPDSHGNWCSLHMIPRFFLFFFHPLPLWLRHKIPIHTHTCFSVMPQSKPYVLAVCAFAMVRDDMSRK